MNVRLLSQDLQRKAELELKEVPNQTQDDIGAIREWLKKQPHLNVNPDDQFILSFLRGCKFNYEKTKKKIELFYSTKSLIPDFFTNRDPLTPAIKQVLNTERFWVPLPKSADPLAPRLFYYEGEPYYASEKIDIEAFAKTILIILDILLHEDDSFIVNGYSVVQCVNGFSASHLSQLSIVMLRKIFTCFIRRYPLRLMGYHIMNASPSIHIVYNMMKPFLPEKLQSRVIFHNTNDFKVFHEHVSKEELPIELGGDKYSVKTVIDDWKIKIQSHRNWLIDDERVRSDESKRIRNIDSDIDIFGIDGSFKRLEFD